MSIFYSPQGFESCVLVSDRFSDAINDVAAVYPPVDYAEDDQDTYTAFKFTPKVVAALRERGVPAEFPVKISRDFPLLVKGRREKPFKHQIATTKFLINVGATHGLNTGSENAFVLNDAGCVDADTEYLSPTGWKRIADYDTGEVGQYDPATRSVSFVQPTAYVKKPCAWMYHFKPKYNIDQMLSPEHRVLLHDATNPAQHHVISAERLNEVAQNRGLGIRKARGTTGVSWSHAACPTSFTGPDGPGMHLTDAQLRLQVAAMADGHMVRGSAWCDVRVKKQRKKARIVSLLQAAGVSFTSRDVNSATAKGYTVYRFVPPMRDKSYGAKFWSCSRAQLAVIADEVLHWDGCTVDGRREFTTLDKPTADFVQYAFSATGSTARLVSRFRNDKGFVEHTITVQPGKWLSSFGDGRSGKAPPISKVPTTDGFKYCFEVPTSFLVFRRNGCVFASGNTGKTLSVIWAWHYLRKVGHAGALVVLCPKSIVFSAWAKDIMASLPQLKVAYVVGDAKKRTALCAPGYDVYVMNHDGIKFNDAIFGNVSVTHVAIDEASAFNDRSTERFKKLREFCKNKTVWAMTATPVSHSPDRAWALAQLVDKSRCEMSFGRFRSRVCYEIKLGQFSKWNPRPGAEQIVFDTLQPAIRFKKSDCLDLPPLVYEDRHVTLSADQKKFADKLIKDWQWEETHGGQATATVSGDNAAIRLNKLLQCYQGAIIRDDKSILHIDCKARLAELCAIIDESDGKIIVATPFRAVNAMLIDKLGKVYGRDAVASITGSVNLTERTEIVTKMQDPLNPLRVLCAHPETASHGLTLTEASTTVWYGPYFKSEFYAQMNERMNRPGQQRSMRIVHLISDKIEQQIFSLVRERLATQDNILGLYRKVLGA